jgi:hypothetical protein
VTGIRARLKLPSELVHQPGESPKIGVEPRFLETAVRPLFKLRFDPIFAYLRPPIFVTSVTVICAAKTDNRRQIRTQTGQADADGQENRRKGRDS